jgi:hypothetical protein
MSKADKPPIAVIWDGKVFRPADPYAAELADAIQKDTRLNGRFTRPIGTEDRRAGLLRLWWAGLGLLHDNIDDERWPSKRKLHNLILEELGYVEKIWRIDGTYRLVVDSVAIDNMEDDAFDGLFEKARSFVVTHWGFDPWDMWVEEKKAEMANKRQGYR